MGEKLYNSTYKDNRNNRIAFPMGGIGAGMICMTGTGGLSHFSLRNDPNLTHEPFVFSAVCIKQDTGNIARVLEGPLPSWKIFGSHGGVGTGLGGRHYGFPRFSDSSFRARFPFGIVELKDGKLPLTVMVKGWSPFTPPHADDSSLPVIGMEFTFKNITDFPLELVYSFNAINFMATGNETGEVLPMENGFVLNQPAVDGKPWEQGAFCAVVDQPQTSVNYAWFRGGWFDPYTMVWNSIESGSSVAGEPITEGKPSPGASIFVPLELGPHEEKTIRLMLSWYVPEANYNMGIPTPQQQAETDPETAPAIQSFYKPWYSGKFADVLSVSRYWQSNYESLHDASACFSDCFYDTTLPPEVIEAVAANLSILKSPTVLRQTDGRLWAWEGVDAHNGSCHGSCTHVWNYAQAVPHLFPELERSLRKTEFNECQDESGHQNFRAPLPIQAADHLFHAAADGQLGGIMNIYREWRISGDTEWLRQLWPKVKQSLYYCIEIWDPEHKGILEEPHHNTYDIEFWGPDGMCSSMYLGALKAASQIAKRLDDPTDLFDSLYLKGVRYLEDELFNGEFFEQKIQWEGLKADPPFSDGADWNRYYSPEAEKLLKEEGPKYQYGKGCLSDGIIGAWIAEMCGLGDILDREKVKSHLLSVYKYNLQHDLSEHANPQRPGYALGREGGLLLCTWPNGGKLTLPFVYSNEVWTGIEYQVASHLLSVGCTEEALDIIRTCRDRYDGHVRNPFDEYECGHWYARALASYGLIQGMTGIRYDAYERTLYVSPNIEGDFRSFLCTENGFGVTGIRDGKPFFEIRSGDVPIEHINFNMEIKN
jgi:uncharacterized protein (DUF608 family)